MTINMKFKHYLALLLIALMTVPAVMAGPMGDDDDKDPSIQRGIRRLHPERERAKAIKKLREQMSRKADPNADPWDTTDEVWGTVDLPPTDEEVMDSVAVEGHRLTPYQQHTSKTPEEQAALDSLLAIDYYPVEYGYRRMKWQDIPVTTTVEQLVPGFVLEDGECRSKYVSMDSTSNEVFFAFTLQEDSVPGPLRLCVHYCADDPLDFDQIVFTIDGYDYMFYPADPQRGTVREGIYWERSDDVLKPVYKDLVYALVHSNWVAMKLVSSRGIHHVKMLTDGQRLDFAHTLDLYRLLGGII
jgi:hypothetical protein